MGCWQGWSLTLILILTLVLALTLALSLTLTLTLTQTLILCKRANPSLINFFEGGNYTSKKANHQSKDLISFEGGRWELTTYLREWTLI